MKTRVERAVRKRQAAAKKSEGESDRVLMQIDDEGNLQATEYLEVHLRKRLSAILAANAFDKLGHHHLARQMRQRHNLEP